MNDGRAAPTVAVDVALFTVLDGALHVLLVPVRHGPFAGQWALPGGRVGVDEPLDAAAARYLTAETGVRHAYLEQLYTFGSPHRDPHGRVVSVAYFGLVASPGGPSGARALRALRSSAAPGPRRAARLGLARAPSSSATPWTTRHFSRVTRLPRLAYDHGAVVKTARARLRGKLTYTNLVYSLLPRAFTLAELQEMYEAILGRPLDRRNFRKKVLSLGLLRPLGRLRRGPHRPAALHAFRHRRPMVVEILS